jgi:hypothetical protein
MVKELTATIKGYTVSLEIDTDKVKALAELILISKGNPLSLVRNRKRIAELIDYLNA